MKKQLLLLVSLLLPLISGCGSQVSEEPTSEPTLTPTEEPTAEPTDEPTVEPTPEIVCNYKESEYTAELNMPIKFSDNMESLSKGNYSVNTFTIKNNANFLMNCTGERDDYYTCAYIHKGDLEFMHSFVNQEIPVPEPIGYGTLSYLPYFSGINCMYNNYHSFINEIRYNHLIIDYTFKDIKWYEIPFNEDIPEIIGDYQLALISLKEKFDCYDLDGNYISSMFIFVEQVLEKYYIDDNGYYEIQMRLFNYLCELLMTNNRYLINFNAIKTQHINGDDLYRDIFYGSVMIENIEGEDYISLFSPRYDGDNDYLIKYYDYFINNNMYYFKLSDMISFIKEQKNM